MLQPVTGTWLSPAVTPSCLLPTSACSEQQEGEHGVHTSALKEPCVLQFLLIFLLGGNSHVILI